jgi:hypothetical protein
VAAAGQRQPPGIGKHRRCRDEGRKAGPWWSSGTLVRHLAATDDMVLPGSFVHVLGAADLRPLLWPGWQ